MYRCYSNRRPSALLLPLVSGLMKGSRCVGVVMLVVAALRTPPRDVLVWFLCDNKTYFKSQHPILSAAFSCYVPLDSVCNFFFFFVHIWSEVLVLLVDFLWSLFLERAYYLLKYFIPTLSPFCLSFVASAALA